MDKLKEFMDARPSSDWSDFPNNIIKYMELVEEKSMERYMELKKHDIIKE